MEKSLKMRKAKARARVRDKTRGRDNISLAATVDSRWVKGPLLLDKVHVPDLASEDA